MADETNISWCDRTFNPIIGCTKVSPACTNCYAAAETFVRKERSHGRELWGPKAERHITSDAYYRKPFSWNKVSWSECLSCGWRGSKAGLSACPTCGGSTCKPTRQRVFCASMSDVFEDHPTWEPVRERLFAMMTLLSNLDWLILTKRPENVISMVPTAWLINWPENVWMGTTIETQEYADKRLPYLVNMPAKVRFVSAEPLLGEIKFNHEFDGKLKRHWLHPIYGVNWVITGGESGHHARPTHPDWFRSLRDQCQAAGVPFLFKQHGEWEPAVEWVAKTQSEKYRHDWGDGTYSLKVGRKNAGHLLDGKIHHEFPK